MVMVEQSVLEKRRAEKIERQNKGLHGGPGVDGLTGRWRGIFYLRGEAMRHNRLTQPITHIQMYKNR